ncbi:MAG TPA: hypothetical protein VM577_05510, partial [Anaerovoracaceae bacterium]|nr:hypothetical protein [Anaerovoracaceae bacterium]
PNGYCFTCGGSGWKVVHRQGDLVPGTEYRERNRMILCQTTYASTLYSTCDCCIIKTEAVAWPSSYPQKL